MEKAAEELLRDLGVWIMTREVILKRLERDDPALQTLFNADLREMSELRKRIDKTLGIENIVDMETARLMRGETLG